MASKEIVRVYETVLSSPGMADQVKIDLRTPRKNILLLARLMDSGLELQDGKGDELFLGLSKESIGELNLLSEELLKKAGLTEFYEKLKSL